MLSIFTVKKKTQTATTTTTKITQGHEKTFGGDGFIYYLDCVNGNRCIPMSNS